MRVAAVSLDLGGDESLSYKPEVLIHIAALIGKDKETRAQKATPAKVLGFLGLSLNSGLPVTNCMKLDKLPSLSLALRAYLRVL